jgi:hypothetical protein
MLSKSIQPIISIASALREISLKRTASGGKDMGMIEFRLRAE